MTGDDAYARFEQEVEKLANDLAFLGERAQALGNAAWQHRIASAVASLTTVARRDVAVRPPIPEIMVPAVVGPSRATAFDDETSKAMNTICAMLGYVAREAQIVGAYDVMGAALTGYELARQERRQPTRQ